MEDRVGEVLARRAALDSGAAPAIALSILLHAGITGFAAWRAWHDPKPTTLGGKLQIQFASAPRMSAPAPLTPKARPAPKMEVPIVPQPIAAPLVQPNDKVVAKALTGQSTKKGVDALAPTTPPPAPATSTIGKPGVGAPATDVPIGGSGVTGIEGDFRDAAYIERMRMLIGTHWLRPASVAPGTVTTIYFIIDRDGKIRDVAAEKPSGNGMFDRNALRAVLESSPLPPLPYSYNGLFVGVHLTFK
ncbi:MAG: TonB family protein [Acidobacteria bacterium]|nr:TonB family protein [Acidobacteriota bacterium]